MAQSLDEITDVIAMAALPLPAALRSAFTVQVLTRLRACPAESVGVGLAHRIAAEEQRNFLKAASNAVGPDEARATRAGVARSGRRLARASLPQCRGPLQDHDPQLPDGVTTCIALSVPDPTSGDCPTWAAEYRWSGCYARNYETRSFWPPAYPFVAQPCYDLWRRLG